MADVNDLLLDTYARVGESVPAVLDGLSPDDAAWRPAADANSLGWLVWHLTRVLDDHLATLSGREQVHTAQGFAAGLGLDLPESDTGWSHSSADVAKVRFADLAVLTDYHAATQTWAADYLREVADLDQVVDERWDPPVTLSARLVSVADDMARHIGQAAYVRGLLGARG